MISKLGIYSILGGLFVAIFSGISKFMESENFWVDLTISKVIGEEKADAIILFINVAAVQTSLDFLIYEVPFFAFLIGLGCVFFIISLFFKNY